MLGAGGHAVGVRFARQRWADGCLQATGKHESRAADRVLKAIGQKLDAALLADTGLALQGGRIKADDDGRTSVPGLFAGGDCRLGGRDLTVDAVQDGKRATLAMYAAWAAWSGRPWARKAATWSAAGPRKPA